MQWFWSGVFGELYGGANETRFALDMPESSPGFAVATCPVPCATPLSARIDC